MADVTCPEIVVPGVVVVDSLKYSWNGESCVESGDVIADCDVIYDRDDPSTPAPAFPKAE